MWCLLGSQRFLCLILFFLNFQVNPSSSSFSSSSSMTQVCSHDEAAALIEFRSSFSTGRYSSFSYLCNDAESYPKTDSWKEGTDCCQWDGVTCDNETGQVIGLDLSCSWLYGKMPSDSSLFCLQHLQKLNLAFNALDFSKMPSKFGEFSSLVYLNLSQTIFAGEFPLYQLYNLSKLVSLDLSWAIDEPLDKHTLEGLVHNLRELRQLFLDGVNMSSINPNLLMNLSSSLRSLSLVDCHLQGKFPENIFYRPNLKSLYLGRNGNLNLPKLNQSSHLELLDLSYIMSFSTEFIHSIGNLQSLKYLYLLGASFPEGVLDSIMNLSSLELLDASMVDLPGRLPDSIGNLVSLKHLTLSALGLWGSIPRSLGNLSQLNYLELSYDQFSGKIPSSLTNLTQLEFLSLSHNQLGGSIPDEVTAFPNLISLDLSHNFLNGALPSWLYRASSLEKIFLSKNQLSGHIKEFQSKSLAQMLFDNNKLQGPIPSSISQLVNLTDLSLSANNLSGFVEVGMFSKLQNLKTLDLSYNSLSLNFNGTSADYAMPNLLNLHLASCNVDEFPQFLRGSKILMELDLSNNRIYGKIPKWMWDVGIESLMLLNLSHNSLTDFEQLPWKQIDVLDLSSNLIHGDLPIPASIPTTFFISNNSLSGEISSLICNRSSIRFLDLSHNNLSGIIPHCFGNLSKSLLFLNLRMNKFHGIIPPTFIEGCQLMNLNLNGNELDGPLTRSINNCRSLEVLDLGNNKINGTFPHWLAGLPKLQVLGLRSNQLHGSIQDGGSNPSFSNIQIFDLSNNYFTGPLPVRYIKNFKSMINLTKDQSAMLYMGVSYFDHFYGYSIGIALKGQGIELVKIFTMLTSIDLSKNKFEREIPEDIGKLNSLKGLNLSHNSLSGYIPASIGNLMNLEWLDLSSNRLIGMIPERLLDLTSLSTFNVSENQLHGQIPQGKQFNTFGNDSYEGNKGLCGFPVSKGCSNNKPPSNLLEEDDDSESNFAFGWKVVLIGYGCGLVFGLAMGYVVFRTGKPKWLVVLVEDR